MEHHLLEQARHADARCVPVQCNCASYHRGPDASSLTMGESMQHGLQSWRSMPVLCDAGSAVFVGRRKPFWDVITSAVGSSVRS